MYPHTTQSETRDAEIAAALRLARERREAASAVRRPHGRRQGRLRALAALLARTS